MSTYYVDGVQRKKRHVAAFFVFTKKPSRWRFFWNGNRLLPGHVTAVLHALERTAGPDAIWRFAVFSLPDLDQKDGLNEADISPLEQGTLLPPPSPALAFPTLPNVHTLLTVCASAPMGRSAERKYLR